MKKLLMFLFGIFGIGMSSADVGSGYGMMGTSGTGMMYWGFIGGLIYFLVIINLVFLALYLYKKIWEK